MNQEIRYTTKKLVLLHFITTLPFKINATHPTTESSANFMRLHTILLSSH